MFKVSVPATSANIGGGFDCMGLALDVCNEVYLRVNESFLIDTDRDLPNGPNNLVYRSIIATFEYAVPLFKDGDMPDILREYLFHKHQPLKIYIKQINRIPKTSGLGSSAACIVAGVTLANRLLNNVLNKNQLIKLCTKLDGHPDNVLPALLGGAVTGMVEDNGDVQYIKVSPPKELLVQVYTPSFCLETKVSRKILPECYSRADVVYSMSRALLTFASLGTGDLKVLKNVVGDKLHEPYRATLIPDFEAVKTYNNECGAIAVYLSGAGPSIAAFVTDKFRGDKMEEKLSFLPNNWKMMSCEIAKTGAKIEEIV